MTHIPPLTDDDIAQIRAQLSAWDDVMASDKGREPWLFATHVRRLLAEVDRLRAAEKRRRDRQRIQMREGWTNEQRIAIRGAADLLFMIGANQDEPQWQRAYSDAALEILMNCHPEDYETWKTLTEAGRQRREAETERDEARARAEKAKAVLLAYQQWEADIILDRDRWLREGMTVDRHHYDRMIEIQAMRNEALGAFKVSPDCGNPEGHSSP